MAAEAMGVSTMKLNDMLENGEVLAEDLLPKLADVLEGRFAKAAVEASSRAQASFNRFTNSITNLQRIIGESGFTESLANLVEDATDNIEELTKYINENSREIRQAFQSIEQSVKDLSSFFGSSPIENALYGISDAIEAVGKTSASLVNTYNSLPDGLQGGILVGLLGAVNPVLGVVSGVAALLPEFNDFFQGLNALERGGITFSDFFGNEEDFEAALKAYQRGLSLIKAESDTQKLSVDELKDSIKAVSSELEYWSKKPFSFYSDDNEEKLKKIDYFKDVLLRLKETLKEKEPLEFLDFIKSLGAETTKSVEKSDRSIRNSYLYSGQAFEDYKEKGVELQKELNKELGYLQADQIEQERQDAVKAAEDKWGELIEQAKGYPKQQKKISTSLQNEINKINEDAAEKRKKLKEKELKDLLEKEKDYYKKLQELEVEAIDNIFAINLTNKERRMRVDKDVYDAVKALMDKRKKDAEDAFDEEVKAAKDAAKKKEKYLDDVQDAYDDLYKDVKDFTRDVIDDWDDMGNTLIDLTEKMIKDIAAAFLAQKIVMPITLAAGDVLGLSQNGIGFGDISDNAVSPSTLFSAGKSLISGDIFGTDGFLAGFGFGPEIEAGTGAVSWTGALSKLGSLAGGAAAMSSLSATFASSMGTLGTAIGQVLPVVGLAATAFSVLSSVLENEPDPRVGFISGKAPSFVGVEENTSELYNYYPWLQDVDNREGIGDAVRAFFDAKFQAIDSAFDFEMSDVIGSVAGKIIMNPEDYGGDIQAMISDMEAWVIRLYQPQLLEGLQAGLSNIIPEGFFKDIALENEGATEAFIRFGNVVEETDNFIEVFTTQMNDFGLSAQKAFENISTINTILKSFNESISAITNTSVSNNMSLLNEQFNELIKTLSEAHATVEQLNKAEQDRNTILGANLTGLNASSVQSALMSGTDVTSIVQNSINTLLSSQVSEIIIKKYITPLNEEIGKVFSETGGDLNAVLYTLANYDLSGLNSEIISFQTQLDWLFDDVSTSLSQAEDDLNKAIDKEEELRDARLSASESIDDLLFSLYGGDLSPVQSIEFFEDNYNKLLEEVTGAKTADDLSSAISDLTSFVPDYLDFAAAYGGDYNALFNKITNDLKDIGIEQKTEAEKQIEQLEYANSILGNMESTVLDISTALNNYFSASGSSTGTSNPALGYLNQYKDVRDYYYLNSSMLNMTPEEYANFHYQTFGQGEERYWGSYSDGGVSVGPNSGYPVELHGTELIVPLNDPGNYTTTSNTQQNFEVKVYIGNREIDDVVVKVIEVNPEAQNKIRRVVKNV